MQLFDKQKTLNSHGRIIEISTPMVMGVLNITPDSFYENSRVNNTGIISKVNQMITDGADIIDIGAYSSRPGATHISEQEEWERLEPALKAVRTKHSDILVSVDTFRSEVARLAIEYYGVNIINDISAGEIDANMMQKVGKYRVPYIMMHMQGTPQNMQNNPNYKYIVQEILTYFSNKVYEARQANIHDIILDPGFGFGKTLNHNYELLRRLDEFEVFELPVLAGVSRKSMIYKLLNNTPEQALNGTTVLNTIALAKGADILRVHDVKEAVEAVRLFTRVEGVNTEDRRPETEDRRLNNFS